MAPTHRLLLVFLLLVALHARAAWAAPWRAQGADEDADNGASWLDVDLEPLEHPGAVPAGEGDPTSRLGSRSEAPADRVVTDVPVGRAFPAPQLDAVPQAGWHRRGPPRAQYHQAEGGKKRPEPSPLLRKMLDELERRHKTDREAVKKLLFPDGSSGSLPVPPDEAQATQGAGTPVLSESGEDHQASRCDFFQADSGFVGSARLRPDASRQGSCNKGELLRSRVAGLLLLAGPEIPRLRFPVVLGPASSSYPGDSARKTAELWAQPGGTVSQPLDGAAQRDVLPSPQGQLTRLCSSSSPPAP
ncbi:uncharacterized protein LOC129211499 [Grus americana]|uniref:uncharacterized protein LOC129211499 n=1 Tax=Grus americana TaxID=9117 RepID=UPI002407BCBA|nr:uncharacterized protein LOC129211499 [Grus americana]